MGRVGMGGVGVGMAVTAMTKNSSMILDHISDSLRHLDSSLQE